MQRVALVLDISESGLPHWRATRAAALAIVERLSTEARVEIYLLGGAQPFGIDALLSWSTPPGGVSLPCSLIGPTAHTLDQSRMSLRACVVIGSGPVFDIGDSWMSSIAERWLLVRSGPEALQHPPGQLREVPADDLETVLATLAGPPDQRPPGPSPLERVSQRGLRWATDPTGYPLVWVDPVSRWLQLFPVTKPQFERYLVAGVAPTLGDTWYHTLLNLNNRATLQPGLTAYEQALLTGLNGDEALAFAVWLGPSFALLETAQWRTCHDWLAAQSSTAPPRDISAALAPDAALFWEIVERTCRPRSLLDLSLMTQGVKEWSVDRQPGRPRRLVGLGKSRPAFSSRALRSIFEPVAPVQPRLFDFGARLCATEITW